MSAVDYVPRLADGRLAALLDELPAVMVTGPTRRRKDDIGSPARR